MHSLYIWYAVSTVQAAEVISWGLFIGKSDYFINKKYIFESFMLSIMI